MRLLQQARFALSVFLLLPGFSSQNCPLGSNDPEMTKDKDCPKEERGTHGHGNEGNVENRSVGAVDDPPDLFGEHYAFEVMNPLVTVVQRDEDAPETNETRYKVIEPMGFRKVRRLVEAAGFDLTIYNVTTADQYMITLFRITDRTSGNKNRQPVYIGHGIMSSAADWVVLPKDSALPFVLIRAGYDVWLGNARGNNYAMHHMVFEPTFAPYWDFSVHEMGIYDVPAIIDFILNKTNSKKINYIGYSESTTSFFICMSENSTKYAPKINKVVAIAPAILLTNTNPIAKLLTAFDDIMHLTSHRRLSGGQLVPWQVTKLLLGKTSLCGMSQTGFNMACKTLIDLIAGDSDATTNSSVIAEGENYFPSATSAKTFIHYIQFFRKRFFRKYDYGPIVNQKRYGSLSPPNYDLTKYKGDLLVFYGQKDKLTHPTDVIESMYAVRKDGRNMKLIPVKPFNHVNFQNANEANALVYKPILEYFNKK